MLVGDHGRIIPFRRFKGIAIGGLAIVVIAVAALIVLAFMYKRQSVAMVRLQDELEQVRQQVGLLRDEKDVLLAQLVIRQKMDPNEISTALEKVPKAEGEKESAGSQPPPPEVKASATQAIVEPVATPPSVEKPEPEPPPKPTTKPVNVKLGAEIQRLKAEYRLDRSLLQASFRIYNRNKPREQLSGKSVVIFKNQEDPQTKWFPIPTVQFKNGLPDGIQGKEFKIRNYRTMDFKAYGIKPPVKFNTVVAMVFSDDGKLILSKEFEVHIDAPALPVPEVKAVPASKAPAPEKSATPASDTDSQTSAPVPQPDPVTQPVPESFVPESAPQPSVPILQKEVEVPGAAGSEAVPVSDSPVVSPETVQQDAESSVNFHSNR